MYLSYMEQGISMSNIFIGFQIKFSVRYLILYILILLSMSGCSYTDKQISTLSNEVYESLIDESGILELDSIDDLARNSIKEDAFEDEQYFISEYSCYESLCLDNKGGLDDFVEIFYYDCSSYDVNIPYSSLKIVMGDGTLITRRYDGFFSNELYHADLDADGLDELIYYKINRGNYPNGDVLVYKVLENELIQLESINELSKNVPYIPYDIMEANTISKIEIIQTDKVLLRVFYWDHNNQLDYGWLFSDLCLNGSDWDIVNQGVTDEYGDVRRITNNFATDMSASTTGENRDNGFEIPIIDYQYSSEQNVDKVYFYKNELIMTAKEAVIAAARNLYDMHSIQLNNYYVDVKKYEYNGYLDIFFYRAMENGILCSLEYYTTIVLSNGSCKQYNIY